MLTVHRGRRAVALVGLTLAASAALFFAQPRDLNATLSPPSMDLLASPQEVTILGAGGGTTADGVTAQGDRIGRQIAVGDFNGDGRDDLLVGAPNADGPNNNGRPQAGEAYVFFGSSGASPLTFDVAGTAGTPPGITIYGEEVGQGGGPPFSGGGPGDQLGSAVAAGDVCGDSKDDIIIGASWADGPSNGRSDTGEVYVYCSPVTAGTKDIAGVFGATPSVTIYGAAINDRFGGDLAVGNLNSSGKQDLVVAAAGADPSGRTDAGRVYGIFGAATTSLPATIDTASLGTQGFRVEGAATAEGLGSDVAAGNVNGSRGDEILLGSDGAGADPNSPTGKAYLVRGSLTGGTVLDLNAPGAGNLLTTVTGADGGDEAGSRVAVAEVTGDAYADLLIGASKASGPSNVRECSGEGYIVFGSASPPADVFIAFGQQDVTIYPAEGGTGCAGDELSSVATGDIDGDTTPDILFGSDDADGAGNGRADSGEAYVRYSSSGLPGTYSFIDVLSPGGVPGSVQPTLTIYAAEAADDLGTVAVADFSGDGGGDVVVAAPAADGPGNSRPNAGEVYVLYGTGGGSPPVGGIAELPDVARTPLAASAPSGHSVGVLLAVTAAVAAGAVALGSAAWWVKKRRSSL